MLTTVNIPTNNKISIDLHCHSVNSDGSHQVKEVLDMAKANGGNYLALTDHDTVAGVTEAKMYAKEIGLNLIGGVEISVTWDGNSLVHILGLNVDETNLNLIENLNKLRMQRYLRGQKIAANLAKVGIQGALAGAMKYADSEESLSRTHFSRFLVDSGHAKPGKAFDKFLAQGKPGYVSQTWASLADAVSWIKDSGGVAVIAHPGRYKFTRTKLLRLITQFKELGGIGLEIISSSHSKDDAYSMAQIAKNEGLVGSVGSDFHTADEGYRKIMVGVNYPLPDNMCKAIYPLLGIPEPVYKTIT